MCHSVLLLVLPFLGANHYSVKCALIELNQGNKTLVNPGMRDRRSFLGQVQNPTLQYPARASLTANVSEVAAEHVATVRLKRAEALLGKGWRVELEYQGPSGDDQTEVWSIGPDGTQDDHDDWYEPVVVARGKGGQWVNFSGAAGGGGRSSRPARSRDRQS